MILKQIWVVDKWVILLSELYIWNILQYKIDVHKSFRRNRPHLKQSIPLVAFIFSSCSERESHELMSVIGIANVEHLMAHLVYCSFYGLKKNSNLSMIFWKTQIQ